MLYALSVGLARDPLDAAELLYVLEGEDGGGEAGPRIFPTMPVVIGHPGAWMADPALRITREMLVHGTQRLTILRPLRVGEPLVAANRVLEVVDKGAEGGAIIVTERTLRVAATGEPLARMESAAFCRADGGFGGPRQVSYEFEPVPQSEPEAFIDLPTAPAQALLYRLNGDRNPLHASPGFAARARFARPILHGLCTFAMAAHGVLRHAGPKAELESFEARFSKPVFPGETLRVELWKSGRGGGTGGSAYAFRARVLERDALVLDRGLARLAP